MPSNGCPVSTLPRQRWPKWLQRSLILGLKNFFPKILFENRLWGTTIFRRFETFGIQWTRSYFHDFFYPIHYFSTTRPRLRIFCHFPLKNRIFENMIFRCFRQFWIDWSYLFFSQFSMVSVCLSVCPSLTKTGLTLITELHELPKYV